MEAAEPEGGALDKPGALLNTVRTQSTADPANLSTGELTTEDLELSARENPSRAGTEDQEWAIHDFVACELSREVLAEAATLERRQEAGSGEWYSDIPENVVSVQGTETPVQQQDSRYELRVSHEMASEFAKTLMGEVHGPGERVEAPSPWAGASLPSAGAGLSGEAAILSEALLLGPGHVDRTTAESVASFAPDGRTSRLSLASLEDEALRGVFEKLVRDVAKGLPEGIMPTQRKPSLTTPHPAARARRGLDCDPMGQDDLVRMRPNSECSMASMVPGQTIDEKALFNEVSLELWQEISERFDQAMLQKLLPQDVQAM